MENGALVLGILDCDELAPELKQDYQSYGRMFQHLLAPHCSELQFKVFNVLEGGIPNLETPCSAYLITGSKTGVYDDEFWLEALATFIQQASDRGIPLIGICFGHQMLAHSLGGNAAKSGKGWGIGMLAHERTGVDDNWLGDGPQSLDLLYSHQDQVLELPSGVQCIYGSEFCPIGAMYKKGALLSFQGHPEFTKDYSARLMKLRQKRYAPGQYGLALESLVREADSEWVAKKICQFIRGEE